MYNQKIVRLGRETVHSWLFMLIHEEQRRQLIQVQREPNEEPWRHGCLVMERTGTSKFNHDDIVDVKR